MRLLIELLDSLSCSSFSADASLLACGFSESYIRLWNLKGEKFRGMRSDFQESSVKDSEKVFIC